MAFKPDSIASVSYSNRAGLTLTSERGHRVRIETEHVRNWAECYGDTARLPEPGTVWTRVTDACSEWTRRFA